MCHQKRGRRVRPAEDYGLRIGKVQHHHPIVVDRQVLVICGTKSSPEQSGGLNAAIVNAFYFDRLPNSRSA